MTPSCRGRRARVTSAKRRVGRLEELLRMEHISKRFGNFYANHDVNFSVAKGEVHTLLGENGAGKSTLMSVLFGLYQPEEGEIRKNGKPVKINDPNDATALGIGMVHQHFKLIDVFTVLDNIILGAEDTKMGFLQKKAARKKVQELSERYGLKVDLDAIRAAGHPTATAIIVTNGDDLGELKMLAEGDILAGTPLFKF